MRSEDFEAIIKPKRQSGQVRIPSPIFKSLSIEKNDMIKVTIHDTAVGEYTVWKKVFIWGGDKTRWSLVFYISISDLKVTGFKPGDSIKLYVENIQGVNSQ